MLDLQDAPDVEGIGTPARVPFGARGDPVDADGQDRDRRGHAVAEYQSKGCADIPEPTRPIGLDLSVFDSFGSGDDFREPFPLQRGGDDVQRMLILGVSDYDWNALLSAACKRPLLQGRHRGRFPGALVPATDELLSEARAIAVKMIEAYLA
jgi:hypothetical protein